MTVTSTYDETLSRAERLALAAQARAATRALELAELLESRPDLVGAYAPADLAVEAVRWSA